MDKDYFEYEYNDNITILERKDGKCLIYNRDKEQYPDNQFVWDGVTHENICDAMVFLNSKYHNKI